MPKFLKTLAVLLLLPFVLSGCKIKSINYFPPTPAHFRVVNVLQTTAAVTVNLNSVTAWTNLPFEAMTGYQEIENATTTVSVFVAGFVSPLITQSYNPAGNQFYTLVIYGTLSAPSLAVMSDVTQPPPSGQFLLNVLQAAPVGNGTTIGTYPMDVYLTPVGQLLDTTSPTFTGISYSNSNIVGQFPAGQYQLRMTNYATKTVIYDSGPLTFQEQTGTDVIIYSRGSSVLPNVLLDDSDGAGQQVVANNRLARVKVVNAAFQTGAVDQYLNGVPLNLAVAYPTATLYKSIASGANTVTFEATAAPGATIATLAATFVPATDQSVFVAGFAGSTSAVALTDNNSPPPSGYANVRFVNASPDSPALDVYANDVLLATAVGTYTATAYAALSGGSTYTLVFKTAGVSVLTLTNVSVAGTQTYSVYAVGPAGALVGLVTPDTP
jgi:hypothetical protein